MDPLIRFCHNADCPARGQLGLDNIHSRRHRRYRCTTCNRTFAETRDTPFHRLKKPTELVTIVVTLLCHGCPLQAIVADLRSLAGRHGQRFHEHHVLDGQVELGHVQADELFVKAVARRLWMAMAMAVPSRTWLGGVISPRRDLGLILTVVRMVRRAARGLAFLVCVDGLAGYVTAFARVFRKAHPVFRGDGLRSNPTSDPRRALPRLRTLCTNSKNPRYSGIFSCEMPRCGRSQLRSSDQNPSSVLTCTSQNPSPSSSRANSPAAWQTVRWA